MYRDAVEIQASDSKCCMPYAKLDRHVIRDRLYSEPNRIYGIGKKGVGCTTPHHKAHARAALLPHESTCKALMKGGLVSVRGVAVAVLLPVAASSLVMMAVRLTRDLNHVGRLEVGALRFTLH